MPANSPDDTPFPAHNGNTSPLEMETFEPDVVIAPGGVSLFSLRFRQRELDSGVLKDVSDMAHEAGFIWSVAVTATLWKDIETVPPAYAANENAQGRLWDVLKGALQALLQTKITGTELHFNLILHTEEKKALYTVRLLAEPGYDGEPVITLSCAEKDTYVELGEIVLTRRALEALVEANASPVPYLARHKCGDWGELDREDWAANDRAAREGTRLLSAYTLSTGQKLWIITEWDRSVTTLLLPDDY